MSCLLRQASARRLTRCSLVINLRPKSSFAAGARALCGPRPILAKRPQASQSRGPYLSQTGSKSTFSRSLSPLIKNIRDTSHSSPSPQLAGPTLQSAFPKKTVTFILVLGAIVYFLTDIDILDEPCWHQKIAAGFSDRHDAEPLHSYASKAELEHWMQYHMPDLSAQWRDLEILKHCIENFGAFAGGWEMTEEESLEENMPVTHGCRFRSNVPTEDYFAIGTAPGPGEAPWNYWSIFDGHAGAHTAVYLQWHLHPNLSLALSNLPSPASSHAIHETIKDVFLRTDNDLLTRARHAANWYPAANAAAISALAPAFSGSCALTAAFDPATNKLRVACVGDSRAVLGRWDAGEAKFVAQPLSTDQTGFNAAEVARIKAAHPDEPDILDPSTGRLLGLAVTRAFGDHRWKWDADFIRRVQFKFWGTAPRPKASNAPYMDAEPEIIETDVVRVDAGAGGEAKSDFMIMASDGLWDRISSEDAVACVQAWLEARARGNGSVKADPQIQTEARVGVAVLEPGVEVDVEAGREISWKATPEYFAIEDENAAVCLLRNALGGSRRGLFFGLLSVMAPFSRDAVDDTTVMVVFFDRVKGEVRKGEAVHGHVRGAFGGGHPTGEEPEKEKKSIWWPW